MQQREIQSLAITTFEKKYLMNSRKSTNIIDGYSSLIYKGL
jgi:hypothetical protein